MKLNGSAAHCECERKKKRDTHKTSGSMDSLKQLILINHQHTGGRMNRLTRKILFSIIFKVCINYFTTENKKKKLIEKEIMGRCSAMPDVEG